MESILLWTRYNGCTDPVTDLAASMDLDLAEPGLDTVVTRFTSAPPGGAVELWTIKGSSHVPTLVSGTASSQFADKVVEWLLAHPKP